jgi:hypothetical protein
MITPTLPQTLITIGFFESPAEQFNYLDDRIIFLRNDRKLNSACLIHPTEQGQIELSNYLISNQFKAELLHGEAESIDNQSICVYSMASFPNQRFDNIFMVSLDENIIPSTQAEEFILELIDKVDVNLTLLSSGNPIGFLKKIKGPNITRIGTPEHPAKMKQGKTPF